MSESKIIVFIGKERYSKNAKGYTIPHLLQFLVNSLVFLIKAQQMADFEKHVGKKTFKVILRRQ